MEAAKEDAPKEIEAEAVAENVYCRGSRRGHSPDANELQEKFDALVEETEN
jgi:hypothetical protein